MSLNDDYSRAKNELTTTKNWILWIEPWETIMKGIEVVSEAISSKNAYRIHVLQEGIVTKPIRLWHSSKKLKFMNPVCETITGEAEELPVYFHSIGTVPESELIKKWVEKCPLSIEPLYYYACDLLIRKKWQEFLNAADHYIFMEKKPQMSLTMTKYYCAMVNCYVLKDFQKAVNYLLPCLAEKPSMAEFWCMLGDIYYAGGLYEKAQVFYDNALILGSRRLRDLWPLEVSKYKEYPTKMSEACRSVVNSVKNYVGRK